MNQLKAVIAAGSVALALAAPMAFAQSVNIGGTTLNLGASRADALAVANAQFELSPTSVRNQYTLYPKRAPGTSQTTPYPKALGTIAIENEKLVRVTRNLGSFRSRDGEAAIERMIRAFSSAPNAGNTPAVRTDASLAGDASTSRVYFSYPGRAIQIVIYRPADRAGMATIDITEQYALPGSATPLPAKQR